MTSPERKAHAGLSPSSLGLYHACPRKYYHSKVAKTPKDKDVVADDTNFNVGKSFHKACEDTMHIPSKLSTEELMGICELYELDAHEYYPMIQAMLAEYEIVHKKSGLEVVACEVELETPVFYGFIDVVLKEASGDWWIGDLKTAATFTPAQINGLLTHPQINLYAAHAPMVARKLELDLEKFKGCRYRVTTKSKLTRKALETAEAYIKRLRVGTKSLDFILPFERMNTATIYEEHKKAFKAVQSKNEKDYGCNYGNCFSYYRPCEFTGTCLGKTYSESGGLECITN